MNQNYIYFRDYTKMIGQILFSNTFNGSTL